MQRLFRYLQGKSKDKKSEGTIRATILSSYFAQRYLPNIENLSQKPATSKLPEIIWQFWDNPEGKTTPEVVQASFKSVEKFRGDFERKLLNNSNIENYSDLPGYILDKFKKKQIGYAHFSDLLRLNLLKNHGGVWLDATGYMTDFVPKYIIDRDFFVFLTDEQSGFPYTFMQNCFIRAKKNSFLCEAWYNICIDFWKNETKALDYFQHQLMFKTLVFKNQTAQELFAKMPHISEQETHQVLACNYLFQKFDANEWERIKKVSFFQKLTYKKNGNIWTNVSDYPDTFLSKLCENRYQKDKKITLINNLLTD